FLEAHHRNVVGLGISIDGFYIAIPNLTEGGRGRDWESSMPTKKSTDLAHRLEFRHIGLQEDAVDRTTLECYSVSQQSKIVGHDPPPSLTQNQRLLRISGENIPESLPRKTRSTH